MLQMSYSSRITFNDCDSDHSPIPLGAPESTREIITDANCESSKVLRRHQ
jgi:hypothetical protein